MNSNFIKEIVELSIKYFAKILFYNFGENVFQSTIRYHPKTTITFSFAIAVFVVDNLHKSYYTVQRWFY